MSVRKYDLVVLGSGPAGEKGAAQAAYFGKRVAMVERAEHLGGAATGTTVPSKTLRETALALSGLRARKLYGVDLSLRRQATVEDFLHHERTVKDAERTRVRHNMLRHGVDVYQGTASFQDRHTIRIIAPGRTPHLLQGDIILVATGSSPYRPEHFPQDGRIYDSDTVLDMKGLPDSMVVIGGGVIGCEYACTFAALGLDVHLIHSRDVLLPFLDRDISLGLENSIRNAGINLLMQAKVGQCVSRDERVRVQLDSGESIEAQALMLATGRRSNTDELDLEAAGITPGARGVLAVDDNYRVVHPDTRQPVPGIYAAGDVIGAPALASTSMEQARFAMIKAFNLEPYKEHVAPILPYGIYTIPECSGAGKTEDRCRNEGIDYVVGKASYDQNARGMIIGDHDGFLKLVFQFDDDLRRPMRLLGVHVMGEIASELVHIGLGALISGAGQDLFIDTCYNYPTLGELYKYATYDAMGKRAGRVEFK